MTPNTIRTPYQCTLQLITPLHVGNGNRLWRGLDFVHKNNTIHLLDSGRMFDSVAPLGMAGINAFTAAIESDELEAWLSGKGIQPATIAGNSFPWHDRSPKTILAQIRDGMANPIIPGSSLKGALRTAIVRKLATGGYRPLLDSMVSDLANPTRRGPAKLQEADRGLLEKLLGKEPNDNVMRLLTVGDFTFSRQNLGLQAVSVSRLDTPTGTRLTPKKGREGRAMPPIVVESLTAAAVSCGMVSFDDYLAAASSTERRYLPTTETIDLAWLLDACHGLASHTIETESAFFKDKTGHPAEALRAFYASLHRVCDTLDKEREAIIQMAWGSGWRGMTGQLLEPHCFATKSGATIRTKLELAPQKHYLEFPFPKSRKATVAGGEPPDGSCLPLGWVKLSVKPMEEVRKAARESQRRQQEENRRRQEAAAEASAMEAQWQGLDQLARDLACVRQLTIALTFAPADANDPNQTIWKRFEGCPIEQKRALAEAFKERWQREDRWKVKKGKQFEKVNRVKVVLAADGANGEP